MFSSGRISLPGFMPVSKLTSIASAALLSSIHDNGEYQSNGG